MTRENRIIAILALLGLLMPGFGPVARSQSNTSTEDSRKTFTLSGVTGLPGVTLTGLPGSVKTQEDGTYSCRLPHDWKGRVVPVKVGYVFEPPFRTYDFLDADYTGQDYTPKVIRFTISGNVGVAGATLQGLPGNPMTDPGGNYRVQVDYGWSGTVTPIKEGYSFTPASRPYTQIVQNLTGQDYVASVLTFTISGNAGLPGVMMKGLPGDVITQSDGMYSAQLLYGWSGSVAPSKPGYVFEPQRRTYNRVREDLVRQDYVARVLTFTIAGQAGAPGVMIQGLPGSPVTDQQGRYSAEVPYGWTGRVVPQKEGYEFTPASREYRSVAANHSNEDYAAEVQMVTISDRIAFDDEPIQDVTITAEPGEYKAVTDAEGRYTLKVPYGWSGRLRLAKPGFEFSPPDMRYADVKSDIIDGGRAPDRWPSLRPGFPQASVSVTTSDVLVIPTAEVTPERVAETTEDMRVMLHILREKLSEPRMILGVLRDYGNFFGADRKVEALYLQGTAAVFVIQVDFPYSFPRQRAAEGEGTQEAVDPVWQRARERLYSPPGSRGYGAYGQAGQTQEMTFEQFKEELLRSLKHAANLRNIDPNELVILTIVAQNEETGWPGAGVSGGTYPVGGDWVAGGVTGGSYGRGGRSAHAGSPSYSATGRGGRRRADTLSPAAAAAPATTVLTMQAKKADIDAFAKGGLDFEQFQQKVKTFAY